MTAAVMNGSSLPAATIAIFHSPCKRSTLDADRRASDSGLARFREAEQRDAIPRWPTIPKHLPPSRPQQHGSARHDARLEEEETTRRRQPDRYSRRFRDVFFNF